MNISTDFADKIINRLANNSAVDKDSSLPFDAASLTKTFNAQIKRFADEDTRTTKLFIADAAGLFGMGIVFVLHKLDGLDMLNVFVEPEEVIT